MFTSKGLFSEIPCPYPDECAAPRCIFLHSSTKATPPAQVYNPEDQVYNPEEIDIEKGEEEFQYGTKRKLGEIKSPSPARRPQKPDDLPQTRDSPATGEAQQRDSLAYTREISPPPLRRKAQNGTSIPVKHPSVEDAPFVSKSNGTPSSTLVVSGITPKFNKAPARVETLNPRSIKGHSPASHDLRLRLVRGLHEQLQRLNTELAKDANDEEEKLVLSDQAVISKALDIEESATGTPSIYTNKVKNEIMAYKRMTMEKWLEQRKEEVAKDQAAEARLLLSTPSTKPNEPPKPIITGLSAQEEINILDRLYTPITTLSKYGYVTTVPTDEEIKKAKQGVEAAQGWEQCDRCKSRFQVFPGRREKDGALTSGNGCTYHYGKPYFQERSKMDPKEKPTKRYRCCNEAPGDSAGCTKSENHVFKITEAKRLASILNFEKTPENLDKISNRPICIDGEMGYTVHGLELIRLTATSWLNGEELFDVLVRPIGEVLDLNSRYSGVWPHNVTEALPWTTEPMEDTKGPKKLRIVESPAAARALLFCHLSPHTPLIGHGLENDLNAIRMIHPTIIDTALLYPHKAGLPYRMGLKALMAMHLNRHIQVIVDGKMEGHDSKEDANAAGDLVRLSVKKKWEELQRKGWSVKDGVFQPPATTDSPSSSHFLNGGEFKSNAHETPTKVYSNKTKHKRDLAAMGKEDRAIEEELNY